MRFRITAYIGQGGLFPITCVMDVPKDLQEFLSYPLGFSLYYDYETRKVALISVTKA